MYGGLERLLIKVAMKERPLVYGLRHSWMPSLRREITFGESLRVMPYSRVPSRMEFDN